MLQSNLGIIRSHLLHHLSPEAGGIQNVGFVHAGNLFAAFHGNIKALNRNPANFVFIIGKSVNRLADSVFLCGMALSEIKPSCKLPHNHHIKSGAADFLF